MYTKIRWKQRYQNFEKAFLSLQESKTALEKEDENLFIRDSLIQRYEYTIELSWKLLKDYLEHEKFTDLNSPRQVIRQAFQSKLITDAQQWLEALESRNKTSHLYNEQLANEVTSEITNNYFSLIEKLYILFKKEYEKK